MYLDFTLHRLATSSQTETCLPSSSLDTFETQGCMTVYCLGGCHPLIPSNSILFQSTFGVLKRETDRETWTWIRGRCGELSVLVPNWTRIVGWPGQVHAHTHRTDLMPRINLSARSSSTLIPRFCDGLSARLRYDHSQ